jgi:hypothetical protein
MTAKGNFQPFNASGNTDQIARLKRLLNTRSGHFDVQNEGLKITYPDKFEVPPIISVWRDGDIYQEKENHPVG